jgi:predicted dehydrogenase
MGRPGMVMNDMMVHLAYSSLFFCGKPQRLVTVASNVYFDSGADDQIGITLSYEDGTIGHLWTSWATEDVCRDPWMCTIKVFGARGSGVASWDNVKNDDLTQPGWDDSVYWDSFFYIQRYFIEECLGRGAKPLSTLDDALAARQIIDAAIKSLDQRSWVSLT